MTAVRKFAFDRPTEDAAWLDAHNPAAPYVVIDVAAAEIVSANAAGAEAFGIFSYATYPIAIDPDLSGIARLRNLLPNIVNPCCESLMFRRGGRLRSMKFKISRSDRDPGSNNIRLEIVDDVEPVMPPAQPHAHQYADPERELAPVRKPGPERKAEATMTIAPAAEVPPPGKPPSQLSVRRETPGAEQPPEAPPPPRTDSDTLKQIAQKIREGTALLTPPAPDDGVVAAPVADAPPQGEPPAKPVDVPANLSRRPTLPLDPDHLARLAHELKTPITAIAAAAEIMRDERLGPVGNPKYLEYAADIHESAHHALDVITTLLSESGKLGDQTARLIALDLNAIVARTVSSVQALAEAHHISLAFEAENGRPHVVANPTAIRQILLNLLTNAIKFTPSGGDIRVATGYLPDGRVFMVVRDTGCGMTEKKTPEGDADRSLRSAKLSGGHGIGLPLVRRLANELGAELEIDSAPDKGTVVLMAFGGFARWHSPA